MPTRKTEKVSSPAGPSPAKRAPAAGGAAPPLKESMVNGRASPAKASVGDGWCFCCGGFAGHVKLMFVNGAALRSSSLRCLRV